MTPEFRSDLAKRIFGLVLVWLILSGMTAAATLLPRLTGESTVQAALRECQQSCNWAEFDRSNLTLGDVVAVFGPPPQVAFHEVYNGRYDKPNLYVVLLYPSLGLSVQSALRLESQPIPIATRNQLIFAQIRTWIAMTIPWRGFASVCRYLPHVTSCVDVF